MLRHFPVLSIAVILKRGLRKSIKEKVYCIGIFFLSSFFRLKKPFLFLSFCWLTHFRQITFNSSSMLNNKSFMKNAIVLVSFGICFVVANF